MGENKMPIAIGALLIPIVLIIMKISNLITTKKKIKILLNTLLILIPIIYIVLCLIIRAEPFDFEDHYSVEYMFYRGEYILYAGLIFLFTPFIWIIVVYFAKMILNSIRVRKNAIIKRNEEYVYYRGDLNKVSPSIIMFTSTFNVDIKKSISATILKLKLTGYITENCNSYIYTNKDISNLLESEKMVLNLIINNYFDKNNYEEVVKQETLDNKYIVKNRGGIPFRILKIIIAICIPIMVFAFSAWLSEYIFENYRVYPEDDGHTYIILNNEDEIKQLYYEVKDINDYYHRTMLDGTYISYNYSEIRADKFEYSVVRKAFFLNLITAGIISFFGVWILISLYIVIDQIKYIHKNYRRTIKGKKLLNKAYALKNYLKDYSLIKDRTEEELILWEYYLVYAVVLGVNAKIEDEIIEKYLKGIV